LTKNLNLSRIPHMKSSNKSPWSSTPETSERIVSAIARIANVLRAGSWQFATTEGLNPTQVDILEILMSRDEGVRLSWIAQQMGVTTASASDSVTALVAKNLVEKGRASDDGRAIALRLTAEGKKLATKIADAMGFASEAVNALPESQQQAVFGGLLALIGQLQKNERFPEIRTCVTCRYFAPHEHKDEVAPHHCRLVNAALPATMLRLDCPEHQASEPQIAALNWHKLERI
jgi:DNA-binding MarR family transcriptional regulator